MTALKNFFGNAILKFGLRRRAAKTSTLVWLLVLSLSCTLILFASYGLSILFDNFSYDDLTEFGAGMFIAISVIHILFSVFAALGTASGEISGEISRQTMDLLVCSQMSPSKIIFGKLFSSFSYILLVSAIMLPMYSFISLFGGITLQMVLTTYLLIVLFSFTAASIGLFFSAALKKTFGAEALTVILIGAWFLIWLILALIFQIIDEIMSSFYLSSFPLAYCINIPIFILPDPGCFITIIYYIAITGWQETRNTFELYEILVSLIATPLQMLILNFLFIKGAIRLVNPMKANPRKG